MKIIFRYSLLFFAGLMAEQAFSQSVKVNNFDGKYGVFIAVALVVLIGVFLMLIRLDKKTKKLEKEFRAKKEL